MISVQNLQPLLSGNKIWILLLCLSMASCKGFKPAKTNNGNNTQLDPISGKPRLNPTTGEYETVTKVTENMQNVEWTEDKSTPPITYDGTSSNNSNSGNTTTNTNTGNNNTNTNTGGSTQVPSSSNLSSYNVAVMLPFMSDKFNTNNGRIYEKSKTAINFYGGMELAFKELEREGINLNVTVMDTKASEVEVGKLLQKSEVANANLIIGPIKKGNVKKTANFAKSRRKVFISPISASSGLSTDNPYYLQVSPSLKTHCEAITRHVLEKYDADQVVLVCRNKGAETSRLRYFNEAHQLITGNAYEPNFKQYLVPDVSSEFNNIDVTNYLHPSKKTVFIVPSWSSESFINSFLRVVRIAKNANIEASKQAVVYGMPKWQEYKKISYDYYEDLNVHISSSYYLDPANNDIKGFKQRYYNEYGTIPDHNAFIGYDVTRYFARMMAKHGDQFQSKIIDEEDKYLHTKFSFLPVAPSNATSGNDNFRVEQYENKHVNILEFKQFYFQIAD